MIDKKFDLTERLEDFAAEIISLYEGNHYLMQEIF